MWRWDETWSSYKNIVGKTSLKNSHLKDWGDQRIKIMMDLGR
jgi:hypothetical protein